MNTTYQKRTGWPEKLRTMQAGETEPFSIAEYHNLHNARNRETAKSGATFGINRPKGAKTGYITCLSRPIIYSKHGITVEAYYIGNNAVPTDADTPHKIKVYTGIECMYTHKEDGTFQRQYDTFDAFLKDWKVV